MTTLIFRKRSAAFFSIERLFDAILSHLRKTGVDLQRLELPYISTGILSVLRNACFVALRRKGEILHITGDVHYAALFCPLSKTIITVHDCVVLQRGTGVKRFILWALWFGLPMRFASAIVVISAQTKLELLKTVAVPEGKVTVIPNFVDPAFIFSERSFMGERPRILHVGTTANKNLARVVGALRDVACVLVIVGQIPRPTLEDLQQSGICYENHVGLDDESMARLYCDCDIISFPSTYEGFGMPILEGQAVGRPVLTSDLEPMRSVAGEGGALLVDPLSVDAIREGFLALVSDGLLRDRLIAAGKANSRKFTLEGVAASYAALYRKLTSH
jgi:glycosyltransferase involved in cell wall biosynthesis